MRHKVANPVVLLAFFLTSFLYITSPTYARENKKLFSYENWGVEIVTSDDGAQFCQVSYLGADARFSISLHPDKAIDLQFNLEDEWFGTETTHKDISMRIDRRPYWEMANAAFHRNSISSSLSVGSQNMSVRFINELKRGSKLYLYNRFGEQKAWYSLDGSSIAMNELNACQELIRRKSDW
ncbi:MAG: hypothetical protein V3V13_13410 [Paracoccaceae bacterium]